jgi:signal transduction histidine kinase
MMLILFLLAWRANSIAAQHEKSLVEKISEARAFAAQNDQLRQMAEDARFDAMHSNERLLGQVGQDLHDGPIQLLSILTLKLSELLEESPAANAQERSHLAAGVRNLSEGILAELRDISTGLVLPELEGLTAEEAIWLAVRRHENTTGTSVECEIGELTFEPSSPLRICMFRIVQEGLNNAFHHANGRGQRVAASLGDHQITIAVTDCGANENGDHCSGSMQRSHRRIGMGLPGLRRRVEAFNGSFEVSSEGNRTRMVAVIPV